MHRYVANWWVILLRGLLAVLLGLATVFWPGVTLTLLVLFIGIYLIFDGVVATYSGIVHRQDVTWWGWLIAEGVAGLVAGGISLLWPQITAYALLYLVAFWALLSGVFELLPAIQFRYTLRNEWLMILGGLISVALGVMLMVWPGSGLLALTWLIGFYALFFGIILVSQSFRLRRYREVHANI